MGQQHPRGHRWERYVAGIVARDHGICHICGHGGARQLDLLQPHTEHPELAWVSSNAKAAHGAPGNPCPTCSPQAGGPVFCNQLRGMGSVARAQRIIAERIKAGNPPGTENARRPVPSQDAGREW